MAYLLDAKRVHRGEATPLWHGLLSGVLREAIERLKELRTALISAAVTGKIDVREEAIV